MAVNRVGSAPEYLASLSSSGSSSISDMEDSGYSSAADAQSTEALQDAIRNKGHGAQRGADDLPAAADQLSPPWARATQLVQWYRSSGRRGRLHVALVTGEGAHMLLAEQATEALSFLCCVPSHSSVPPKRESDASVVSLGRQPLVPGRARLSRGFSDTAFNTGRCMCAQNFSERIL